MLLDRANCQVSPRLSEPGDANVTPPGRLFTHANRIRLAVGLAVTLLLIGTAMFAALAIGKPIRRIGEVLMGLANGNTRSPFPTPTRGDEIGDTARVAGIFKDNLAADRRDRIRAESDRTTATGRAEIRHAGAGRYFRSHPIGRDRLGLVTLGRLQTAVIDATQTADVTQELTVVVAGRRAGLEHVRARIAVDR